MKMTKKWIIAVSTVLSLCLMSPSVWAGSKQQHRWEGVAIGVGAAIVGSALINHHALGYHSGPPVAFSFNYRENHRYSARHPGYSQPYNGGPHNHWRYRDRGQHYQGHRQHGNAYGKLYRGNWKSPDRWNRGDSQRSHNRRYGGRRY